MTTIIILILIWEIAGWLGYYLTRHLYLQENLMWNWIDCLFHVPIAIVGGPTLLISWVIAKSDN